MNDTIREYLESELNAARVELEIVNKWWRNYKAKNNPTEAARAKYASRRVLAERVRTLQIMIDEG